MEAIALLLLIVGLLVMGITGIVLLTKAFQTSILWGLEYLFVPFASLIFVFIYWSDIKSPSSTCLPGSSCSSLEWRSEARARWPAPQARRPRCLASIGWHVVCASGALDQEKVGGR